MSHDQPPGMLDQPSDIVLVGGKELIGVLIVMLIVKTLQLKNSGCCSFLRPYAPTGGNKD